MEQLEPGSMKPAAASCYKGAFARTQLRPGVVARISGTNWRMAKLELTVRCSMLQRVETVQHRKIFCNRVARQGYTITIRGWLKRWGRSSGSPLA